MYTITIYPERGGYVDVYSTDDFSKAVAEFHNQIEELGEDEKDYKVEMCMDRDLSDDEVGSYPVYRYEDGEIRYYPSYSFDMGVF